MDKVQKKVLVGATALVGLSLPSMLSSTNASVTLVVPGGSGAASSATAFPSTSENGAPLGFNSLNTQSGATLATGASQGVVSTQGLGEIFNWTGPNSTLAAITFVDSGGGGTAVEQPLLYNLGTTIYSSGSQDFNPSAQTNLLASGDSITAGATGGNNFEELDFAGADATVTLITGDSYAFTLLNTSGSNLNVFRSSGTQSDPNGDGYTFSSTSATTDNAQPFSGAGIRNLFIGVYATPVPEPTSVSLIGVASLGLISRRRNKRA